MTLPGQEGLLGSLIGAGGILGGAAIGNIEELRDLFEALGISI